jgi:hypothetical protein
VSTLLLQPAQCRLGADAGKHRQAHRALDTFVRLMQHGTHDDAAAASRSALLAPDGEVLSLSRGHHSRRAVQLLGGLHLDGAEGHSFIAYRHKAAPNQYHTHCYSPAV